MSEILDDPDSVQGFDAVLVASPSVGKVCAGPKYGYCAPI